MSHRFPLVRSSAAALALVAATFTAPVSAQSQTVKVGYGIAEEHPLGQGVNRFIQLVEQATGGKMKLKGFPANALGSETQMISAARGGTSTARSGARTAPGIGTTAMSGPPRPAAGCGATRSGVAGGSGMACGPVASGRSASGITGAAGGEGGGGGAGPPGRCTMGRNSDSESLNERRFGSPSSALVGSFTTWASTVPAAAS